MIIQTLQEQYFAQVVQVEIEVWGEEAATANQIQSRRVVCPEGSIVAILPDGSVGGYAAAQRVDRISTGSWNDQTDNGELSATHISDGAIAYGVNMSVPATSASFGLSRAIIAYYARIFIKDGGCSLMCLGSRLPGYTRWQKRYNGTIQDYLDLRRNDRPIDPELCLYEKAGFKLLWEIPGYFPDQKSSDFGAMIAMNRMAAIQIYL